MKLYGEGRITSDAAQSKRVHRVMAPNRHNTLAVAHDDMFPLRATRVQAVVKCAILNTTVLSHKWSTVMGSPILEKVRSEALNLSESERAELAHSLVASLDGASESDVEKAWDAEIIRRLAEIDSGTANLVDREEFGRRMRARMTSS